MSKILSDEEIDIIEKDCWENLNTDNCISFARAIEQAVMVKTGKLTPLYEHPAPSAPEGWQQFSHTLKYLIGTWRDGKGMFPQGSDKYDESIAAAHLLLKEADWQQGRYFPILAAARNEKKLQESAPTETYIHEHTKLPHPGYFGIPKGYWQWALQYHQAMLIEEAKTTPQYPRNDLSAGGLNQIIADRNQP